MEIVIVLVGLAFLAWRFARKFPWSPIRGVANVKSVASANAMTAARMHRLQAAGKSSKAMPVSFGILRIVLEDLDKPVILFGIQGGGKTSLVNMAVNSLFELFGVRAGRTRFVFLDVKNELPSRLHALVPAHVPVHLLNALDQRASVLDFPSIFPGRSDLLQLAYSICPPIPGDQTPYFRNAASQIIFLTAWVLQKHQKFASRPWGLFDLITILSDKRLLRRVMYCDHESRTYYKATLGPNIKSAGDVFSTLRSVVQPLVPAALAELDHPTRFDLKAFLKSDGVAVLGIPPTGSQAILPLFNVFLRRLIEEAQVANGVEDRLILVLDEIAMIDRAVVDAIVTACCLGRSNNIHILAATQSVELLELKFGIDQAHAFLASCASTVAFRCGSRKTADFVVGRFGSQEGIVKLRSWSVAKESSTTTTEHLQIRDVVLAGELMNAPLADPIADSLTFWGSFPSTGNVKVTSTFVRETSVEIDPKILNFVVRSSGERSLRPLSKSDWVALGLPVRRTPRSS